MSQRLHPLLRTPPKSLNTAKLAASIASTENLLIVQDLDGVCMGLVKDPLTRSLSPDYVEAARAFDGHFFVLTNGEHVGRRGVNAILEQAFPDRDRIRKEGLYLPGLAAGGIQWQNRFGDVEYPGVSDKELAFLATVPERITQVLHAFLADDSDIVSADSAAQEIAASVLDNAASPSANLNSLHAAFGERADLFRKLQEQILDLMRSLLQEAAARGLSDSFFIHLAPNLGRDEVGDELIRWASSEDSGTTDFQFMLRGAVKEAGIVSLLNQYYFRRTGHYPLGEHFNARQAPKAHQDLVDLVAESFAPQDMPTLVGVGDTVNSSAIQNGDRLEFKRGGSDRNFLHLIQDLGHKFNSGNVVAYVDSSGGELANRTPVEVGTDRAGYAVATQGPGDPRDADDPLIVDVVFAGGHEEYCQRFCEAASVRARGMLAAQSS